MIKYAIDLLILHLRFRIVYKKRCYSNVETTIDPDGRYRK